MAHPVDTHVGKRLRLRRTLLGMSQDVLGKMIGVTFQQVQKYERGINRIGSSRLYDFSKLLDVPVNFFFDGYEGETEGDVYGSLNEGGAAPFAEEKLINRETLELAKAYHKIKNDNVRKQALELIKALANSSTSSDKD